MPIIGSHDLSTANHTARDWINGVKGHVLGISLHNFILFCVSFFSNTIIVKKCKYMWLENTEQSEACTERCEDTAQTTWSCSSVIHQMEIYTVIVQHGSRLCQTTLYRRFKSCDSVGGNPPNLSLNTSVLKKECAISCYMSQLLK